MILTIFIFFIVLLVLILSHEFGHFIFAKVRGVRVDEFGFGFPPRLFGKQFGETTYTFNALPFGGFVRIYGEDATEASHDPRSFAARSARDRFWIIFAGVLMNMFLAYGLFTLMQGIGMPDVVGVKIAEVVAGSPADRSGLQVGDKIFSVLTAEGEEVIKTPEEVQTIIEAHKGRDITFKILRGDEYILKGVFPRINPPAGEGAVGIAMEPEIGVVRSPWYRAPWDGLKTTYLVTVATVKGLAQFFGGLFVWDRAVLDQVSGPVGIAKITGEASRLGLIYLLQIVALLSINLAVLNVLPFPALDGGRILFLIIEMLKGSPVNAQVSQMVHLVGFVFLIGLMLVITYRDIARIF